MGFYTAMVLASGLLAAADPRSVDAAKKDLERLQGSWIAVSAEADGKKAPERETDGFKLIVEGNKMIFNPKNGKRQSLFELDPSKTPKEIVITPLDGPRKGQSQRGLYSIDQGCFKLCVNNDPNAAAKNAPAGFATKPGDGLRVLELKQQKP